MLGIIAIMFALSFAYSIIWSIAILGLLVFTAFTIADIVLLYSQSKGLTATRSMTKMLSLGDDNVITLQLNNSSSHTYRLNLYDELPFQLQQRNFQIQRIIEPQSEQTVQYIIHPTERGEYHFGVLNAIVQSKLGIVAIRKLLAQPQMTPVYPSIIQMKRYELLAFARISTLEGIKKMRKIGHNYEFEKIKQYAIGDDIRSINWKATGRRNQLMVNQYEDERSQQIYHLIDKSRTMHMPFHQLSLLDYAVNTSLVISNIALRKYDKVGLITFSHLIGTTLPAERNEVQLKKILQSLYYEKHQPFESNYDLLYRAVKNVVRSRSLLFLYTNFESEYAMERALPLLRKINHLHLLVVILFENTELSNFSKQPPTYVSDIYAQTIAQKLITDKKHIIAQLHKHGIQCIFSKPEDLSINTLNKYLELKARGLI